MTPTETNPELHLPDEQSVPHSSWAVSLCFWFTLLLAASIYGSVALAPKFAVWNRVKSEYDGNIRQLVSLEEDVDYLERVEHALKTDPEFVQRLVGASLPGQATGEELIPVSGSLLFGQSDEMVNSVAVESDDSFFASVIVRLASDTGLRTILLWASACLTIFAFTFLNDAGAGFVHACGALIRQVALVPVTRYFGSEPPSESASTLEVEK